MTTGWGLLAIAALVFVYALCGKRLSDSVLTGPMLFLFAGWSFHALGLIELGHGAEGLYILAEVSLVVLLFADAAAIDPRRLLKGASIPARMLILGLPLAILFGFGAGLGLMPSWPLWELALVAAILAPTDAALSQPIITDPRVPERIGRSLSAESGLNDGLALPFILFFGCFAVGGVHDEVQVPWWVFVGQQIGLGALIGGAVGYVGGWLLRLAQDRGLTSDRFGGIAVLALAGLAYLTAHAGHGNGFLAAFVAGLAFGEVLRGRSRFVFEFVETEGQILTVLSFFVIGAVLLPEGLPHATWPMVALVLASLFLLRPAAIWLSLTGAGVSTKEKLFYGWFGPRGLATALFALLVLNAFDLLKMRDEILAIAAIAVLLSSVLHGLTAAPAARLFDKNREAEKKPSRDILTDT
ncbi:MAG: sodium:proton antiporter [Pseudomonadota bacterium]